MLWCADGVRVQVADSRGIAFAFVHYLSSRSVLVFCVCAWVLPKVRYLGITFCCKRAVVSARGAARDV